MLKVGLTGNIGAGKTLVSKIFRSFGIPVFYADDVAKNISESDEEIIKFYKDWFGQDIYINGNLNKKMLANIIFNNDEALQKVNNLIHPKVVNYFLNWLKNIDNCPYIIFESAILYNTVFKDILDKIILVTAPLELKINRVLKRDQRSAEEIRKILSRQQDDNYLVKMADYILTNDEKELLVPRIIEIHEELKKLSYS